MAAASLLLRDPRGSRGRECRLVCQNWARIPGSAPHSSTLVISCLVLGISHHAATVAQECGSGLAGRFCHRVSCEVVMKVWAQASLGP